MLARDFPDRVEAQLRMGDAMSPWSTRRSCWCREPTRRSHRRSLTMNGVVRTPRDPGKPATVESTATITNFKINLFGFIILWFEEVGVRLEERTET